MSEIDLVKWLLIIWSKRVKLLIFSAIGFLLGIVYATSLDNKYTVESVFIPESPGEMGLSGGLGGIAAIAGFDFGVGGNSNTIRPALYPEIVYSLGFLKEILDDSLLFNETKKPLIEHLEEQKRTSFNSKIKKYTIGLPSLLLSKRTGTSEQFESHGEFVSFSNNEVEIIELLFSRLDVSYAADKNTVTISYEHENPVFAAEVVRMFRDNLQNHVIGLRILKESNELEFIQQTYREKKKEFQRKQEELSTFKDQNLALNSSSSRITLERIQSEYDILNSLYIEVSKNLESAKLNVKRATPIFANLKEITIPLRKSGPNRFFIVVFSSFLGFFICTVFIIINSLKKELMIEMVK